MSPIEKVIDTQTLTAKTAPDEDSTIETPDLPSNGRVVYYFEGDHTVNLELLSDTDDSKGIPVPANYKGPVGPFRADAADRPRYVQVASGTETVTVRLFDGGSFVANSTISGPTTTQPGTDILAEAEGVPVPTSWGPIIVIDLSQQGDKARRIREAKPYLVDISGGGAQTDWDFLEALDPNHTSSDLPSGIPSDGDGWRRVDNGTIASDGDGPVIGPGYAVRTHLVVLRAQQNGGQETIYAAVSVDEEGT